MRKLTEQDISSIIGTTVKGYVIDNARIKGGRFSDSDHYGIVFGRSLEGYYVTWQFHLDENEQPSVYWGHYFMENRDAAIHDYDTRE
jgi:hypothetical protein